MELFQIIALVTCVSSILTLLLVATAVLPHVKQGMALVRDAILWVCLVLVSVAVIWFGCQQILGRSGPTPLAPRPSEDATRSAAWYAAETETPGTENDRLYRGGR